MPKQMCKSKLSTYYASFRYLTYLQHRNSLNLPFQTLGCTERLGLPWSLTVTKARLPEEESLLARLI